MANHNSTNSREELETRMLNDDSGIEFEDMDFRTSEKTKNEQRLMIRRKIEELRDEKELQKLIGYDWPESDYSYTA